MLGAYLGGNRGATIKIAPFSDFAESYRARQAWGADLKSAYPFSKSFKSWGVFCWVMGVTIQNKSIPPTLLKIIGYIGKPGVMISNLHTIFQGFQIRGH